MPTLTLVEGLKQAASELTIVMTSSSASNGKAQFSSEKFFFIQPQFGTDSADLRKAVESAVDLSPLSDSFLLFTNANTSVLSHTDLRKIASEHADYLFRPSLGCITLSRRYAMYVVSTGEIPSMNNAITNGFSAPMSIRQVSISKSAVKQDPQS